MPTYGKNVDDRLFGLLALQELTIEACLATPASFHLIRKINVRLPLPRESFLVMTTEILKSFDSIFHNIPLNDRQIKKDLLQLLLTFDDCLITRGCLQTISFHPC